MSNYQAIQDFINLAIQNGTIEPMDELYHRNQLLHFLGIHDWREVSKELQETDSLALLDQLMVIARSNHAIADGQASFYEAALMDFITPSPSQINKLFWQKYQNSPQSATQYFYDLARQINQVRTRDIAKNSRFRHETSYGQLEITINLSKPEKDPKAIAKARQVQPSDYPACQLCMANEGYYGHDSLPARSNHRIIRLELAGETWGLQYSPYAYFDEHAIVLNSRHQPMVINQRTFDNLLGFLDQFPHYTIGSNADLPIVGGSILTHDHYQAGRYDFPMARAVIREKLQLDQWPTVACGIVNWPMSVLRLTSREKKDIVAAASYILAKWQAYSDESLAIRATSADGAPHHTITPIARMREGQYELDLVLRDNQTSDRYPDGIFHPHQELHHIKKENIGLIEVMGLAILPARLQDELQEVEKYLLGLPNQLASYHEAWAKSLRGSQTITKANSHDVVQTAVGQVFEQVLKDAGVFKDDDEGHEGMRRFFRFVNQS